MNSLKKVVFCECKGGCCPVGEQLPDRLISLKDDFGGEIVVTHDEFRDLAVGKGDKFAKRMFGDMTEFAIRGDSVRFTKGNMAVIRDLHEQLL